MSFSIEEAKKRMKRYERLARDLLISGLLPVVGVLISAAGGMRIYSIPILLTIVTYLYKVISIIIVKEKSDFLMLVIKEEETERVLKYFKYFCTSIICFSMISYLFHLKYFLIVLLFLYVASLVYLRWYEIRLGLKRISFSVRSYYYKILFELKILFHY
ncbi:MAG: hypothetical protein DSO07_02845 [Thermoproteota archaeon]|nr:MAG: hypothetical protein DSO07_02845 [Candidatus Korarchaeota archaeon]